MARFEKQLVASQKFLVGLRSLPQYDDLCEKQLGSVLKALNAVPCLTTSKVADMLSIIDAEIWGPTDLSDCRLPWLSRRQLRT